MILSAENVFQSYQSVIRILGMDINTFIYVMMGLVVVGLILWYFMDSMNKLKKNRKLVEGKVCCFFGGSQGEGDFELCEIATNGLITALDKKSATAKQFIKRALGDKNSGELIDYYALPDHGWSIDYPIGKPKLQQTKVTLYHFYSNIPVAQFPRDPQKWKADLAISMTSAMARLTKNESGLRILGEELNGAFSDYAKIHKFLKNIPLTMYVSMGTLAMTLIILILIFGQGGQLATVVKFVTGK